MNPETDEDLIWRLFDGELSPDEFAKLGKSLEESPGARALFLEHVDLHNLLGQKFCTPESVARTVQGPVSMDRLIRRERRRSAKYALVAAAAAVVVLGLVFKVIFVKEPVPLVAFRTSEDTVMSVSHLATAGKEPLPGTLTEGSRLELRQGAVELELSTGVTALVEAPADLTLQTKDRIYQRGGRIRFHVPAKASGFQVLTPDLRITDLGTEFGVLAGPGTPDEVHLFKGKVEVTHRHGLRKSEVLSGHVARVAGPAGHLGPTPVRPEEFLNSLRPRIPHLRFSFDAMDGNSVPVAGDHPDVPAFSAQWISGSTDLRHSPLVPGKFGNALRCRSKGDHIRTNWPGISGRSARSVAAWLRLPSDKQPYERESILVWGDNAEFGGKFEVGWNFHPDSGQVGALKLTCGPGYVVGSTDLRDGRWHHLAVVFGCEPDPETRLPVRLYVDGVVEKAGKWRYFVPYTTPGWDDFTELRIGIFFDGNGVPRGTLEGDLDELYIFSGVLTQEGVERVMNQSW
jgi:ferric-dicitrate binding protein FerR (iron transport regulator)